MGIETLQILANIMYAIKNYTEIRSLITIETEETLTKSTKYWKRVVHLRINQL